MRPWHILQWLRDPEESIRKVLKFGYRDGPLPFQADSLLFPSTWPPLQLLTIVAMIHVIQRTLPSPPRVLLRNFCIQSVLYEEWFRILFKERRVALGAVVSVLSFLATARLVQSIFTVDGVAGVLLTPAILASLVAGWMNVVLCNERIVARKKRAAGTPTIRGPAIYASDNLDSQWDGEHIWDTNG
jgi:tryptophan-rich sensory protein